MMSIKLSQRLLKVASFVSSKSKVADVGTDHGYVPIYLVQEQKIETAIAMDIHQGPLKKAKENICAYHLEKNIQTRLSDGVEKLLPKEADSIIIAGMGGGLIVKILSAGEALRPYIKEWILSPQSELDLVREYLSSHGYGIELEEMVCEDNKYYTVMRVMNKQEVLYAKDTQKRKVQLAFGPILLKEKHLVLKEYLMLQKVQNEKVLKRVCEQSPTKALKQREIELKDKLQLIKLALRNWEDEDEV